MTPTRRTVLASVLVAPLAASLGRAAEPAAYWVYYGTYTGGKSGGKGIYRSKFDPATGKLTDAELAAEVGNPSFVCPNPANTVLYAVGETAGANGKGGGVFAYGIDRKTGDLSKIGETDSGGAGPCHVTVDMYGRHLLVANYGGGSWKYFNLTPAGSFSDLSHFVQLTGTGPNKQRQEKPHAHCCVFHPTGGYFCVVDLGTDQVWRYSLGFAARKAEPDKPFISLSNHPPIKLPAGCGPRHIDIMPKDDWAFVCGELDSTANVVKLGDKPEVVQSVSTLPGGNPVPGNSTAEVRIHPSGKFVYVSNRGHNSIAAFGWDGAKLTPIGHATEGIKVPRNFNLDPSGKWMLVASQDGDNVAVFQIGDDGLPKPTGNTVKVGRPVCVKFVPVG